MEGFHELEQARLEKLDRLRQAGLDAFPARAERSHTVHQARQQFQQDGEVQAALLGRLVARREMGQASFADLEDGSGRIQLYLRREELGQETYQRFLRDFDLGDFVAVRGPLFLTRTGELTLRVERLTILAKAIRPLPEKWHGLRDVETRYRQRYLDLIANAEVREIFRVRARAVAALRGYLDERGFLEIETPVLQPVYGGAAARPFVTQSRALDQDLYLRIALELYHKRLIIGGYERVYEIGKVFRNEGVSTTNNPEFTMLECYQAYADYQAIMELTEGMVAYAAEQAIGSPKVHYQGHLVDLSPPWKRVTMRQAILEATDVDIGQVRQQRMLWELVRARGLPVDHQPTWAKLVDELFKTAVEPKLIEPTFVYDYPVELSPLAKRRPDEPQVAERFEPFAGGLELGNAFSELNDPLDQEARFREQAEARAAGDEEAHPMDWSFLIALRHGMPPTGGLGVGVDRLVMLLTDQTSIREVVLFPQLRRREQAGQDGS